MEKKITITVSDALNLPSNLQMPGSKVCFVLDAASVVAYNASFQIADPRSRQSKVQNYQNLFLSAQSITIEPCPEEVSEEQPLAQDALPQEEIQPDPPPAEDNPDLLV